MSAMPSDWSNREDASALGVEEGVLFGHVAVGGPRGSPSAWRARCRGCPGVARPTAEPHPSRRTHPNRPSRRPNPQNHPTRRRYPRHPPGGGATRADHVPDEHEAHRRRVSTGSRRRDAGPGSSEGDSSAVGRVGGAGSSDAMRPYAPVIIASYPVVAAAMSGRLIVGIGRRLGLVAQQLTGEEPGDHDHRSRRRRRHLVGVGLVLTRRHPAAIDDEDAPSIGLERHEHLEAAALPTRLRTSRVSSARYRPSRRTGCHC